MNVAHGRPVANTASIASSHHKQQPTTTVAERASSYAPQHAMNPPAAFSSQPGPPFRPANSSSQQQQQQQQPYQSLSLITMNAFASDHNAAFTTAPAAVIIRRLPLNTTEDTLRLMVVWSKEFCDAEVLAPERSEDVGFRAAILRFKSHAGALEARNMLDGKPNVANDAQMMVEFHYGTPATSSSSSRRYTVESASNAGPSSSTSSAASSAGPGPRQSSSSRFNNNNNNNGAFQATQRVSPTTNGSSYANGDQLANANVELSAHYQTLFSPQSPIGNHLNERTRVTGKSLINNDSVDDDETGELLKDLLPKDPVAYAENNGSTSTPTQMRRPTNPQIPIGRMAGLSLNTSGSSNAGGPATAPLSSFSQPMSSISNTHPISPASMTSAGPPVSYQLGSQHYQRHNFPPVNPADQNPPCNTLYVGNLPIDTSEDELKAMFSKQRGYKRLCFRTKQNGPMCFVEFEDVSFATKALHELYGHPLHNSIKGGIRLSFSKNPLGVRSGQGMSSPGPSAGAGAVQGINGAMAAGGPGSAFSTANGPPPGLAVPPGLGPGRMAYGNNGNNHMNGGAGQYTAASFGGNANNPWNGPVFTGAMAAGGPPPAAMLNGAHNGFPPAYMMGR